jgi:hypothetical protein
MRHRLAAILPIMAATFSAALLLLALPGTAAAKSCAQQVIDDWSLHGELTRTYSVHCLRAALDAVPEDLRDYSNITDDIQAALQAQLARRENLDRAKRLGLTDTTSGGPNRSLQLSHPPPSLYRRAIDNLGTTSADSIPIPLLVLASLGGLLLLSAAGLAGAKRYKAMRGRSKPTPPSA